VTYVHAIPLRNAAGLLLAAVALALAPAHRAPGDPAAVSAKLSEARHGDRLDGRGRKALGLVGVLITPWCM